ncbi:MAG: hypothetical protein MZU91_02610 [Desulfosudis oleivorans]|nr:hypothetical protein [Desulfosudis oleivorans]
MAPGGVLVLYCSCRDGLGTQDMLIPYEGARDVEEVIQRLNAELPDPDGSCPPAGQDPSLKGVRIVVCYAERGGRPYCTRCSWTRQDPRRRPWRRPWTMVLQSGPDGAVLPPGAAGVVRPRPSVCSQNKSKDSKGVDSIMKKFKITGVTAREILDCRWNPTVQVDVWVNDEILGRADVPAGRSTGANEAKELRDKEKRYDGMGVRKAVKNVNEILGPAVIGMDVTDQRKVDEKLRAARREQGQVQARRQCHRRRLGGRGTRRVHMRSSCRCTGTSTATRTCCPFRS